MTNQTDFEAIAGMKCEEKNEYNPCPVNTPGPYQEKTDRRGSRLTDKEIAEIQRDCACQGTGYRFHWLWRECGKDRQEHLDHVFSKTMGDADGQEVPCPHCNDTGYVLIEGKGERLLGLLEVRRSFGGCVIFACYIKGNIQCDLYGRDDWLSSAVGDSELDALASAIRKAL